MEEAHRRFPAGPYCGRVAVLATKRGQERAVARPLRVAGLIVKVPDEMVPVVKRVR